MLAPAKQSENQTSKITAVNIPFFGSGGRAPFFQAKLTVNQPGDAHEQEANRLADQVMRLREGDAPIVQRMPLTPVSSVMRACAECEKEKMQRKETGGSDASGKAAPSIVSDVLSGGGQPMESDARQFMESRFGQDFSQVRIHTDSQAAASASAIQARAYTSGRDVVFGAGEYRPGSDGGRRLLAHELVHIGQQCGGIIQRTPDATLPSADEFTTRIARCIGIWETNRGKDAPALKESTLDTVSGVHASMATIEQATMPYSITALKKNPSLRDKATPKLTLKELNDADARCTAVETLLDLVDTAVASGTVADNFIKSNTAAITATGLTNDDVKTMFGAVALKTKVDTARTDINSQHKAIDTLFALIPTAAKTKTVEVFIQENTAQITATGLGEDYIKTIYSQSIKVATAKSDAKKLISKTERDKITTSDRLGLDENSLISYITVKKNWGEHRAGWQRKAVNAMTGDVGKRIQDVATSNSGMGLAIPVIKSRVDTELAKNPVSSEEDIVKNVAQQNNPNETNYGENVWKNYKRLYSPPTPQPAATTPSITLPAK